MNTFKNCKIIFFTVLWLGIFSCTHHQSLQEKRDHAYAPFITDTALHLINGVLFYEDHQTFTGDLKEAWQNKKLKSIEHFLNGKQDGLAETFYEDGKKESIRWYCAGEKDSVHTGWWWNGNKKYEYHFRHGEYNGTFTEWYQSGKMIQQLMYEKGDELYGKGWRENGELYMNFVIKNGRRYGMNNSNLCYGLKKQEVSNE